MRDLNMMLADRTILLTVAGSRAYGMHTETSDLDVKGVFVPPLKYYFGLQKIEQLSSEEHLSSYNMALPTWAANVKAKHGMEGTVFEIRRFLDLASSANPNILDVLFSRNCDVIVESQLGFLLRKERRRFLTKKCLQTFLGYAVAQSRRIETHRKWLLDPPDHEPTREEFGLPKQDAYPQEQVAAAMSAVRKQVDRWNIDFADAEESTKIFILEQVHRHLAEIGVGLEEKHSAAGQILGIETDFMDLVHKQRQYTQATEMWAAYQAWSTGRNKKRKGMEENVGYDCKHGAHLYRLTMAARTIFETGDLQVYNPDPFLIKVRNGEVRFEELMEKFELQKQALAELAAKSTLPSRVDPKWLEDLSVHIIKEMNKREMQ